MTGTEHEQHLVLQRKELTDNIMSLVDVHDGIENLFKYFKDHNIIKDYTYHKYSDSSNSEKITTYHISCTPPLHQRYLDKLSIFNYKIKIKSITQTIIQKQ